MVILIRTFVDNIKQHQQKVKNNRFFLDVVCFSFGIFYITLQGKEILHIRQTRNFHLK